MLSGHKQREIRRRSDIQLLILCENRSNSIYLNAGFSQRDMAQTIFLSLYFVESYRDEKFHRQAYNSPSRQSPTRSGDVTACKCNVWSNVYASFLAVLLGIQHILPSFGRRRSSFELWRGKTMYRHGANFHLALLHLGQNRGSLPGHQNLPVEQSQNISHPQG